MRNWRLHPESDFNTPHANIETENQHTHNQQSAETDSQSRSRQSTQAHSFLYKLFSAGLTLIPYLGVFLGLLFEAYSGLIWSTRPKAVHSSLGKSLLTSGQVVTVGLLAWTILTLVSSATAIQVAQQGPLKPTVPAIDRVLNQIDSLVNSTPSQSLIGLTAPLQTIPLEVDNDDSLLDQSLPYNPKDLELNELLIRDNEMEAVESSLPDTYLSKRPIGFFGQPQEIPNEANGNTSGSKHRKKKRFSLQNPLRHSLLTSAFGWRWGRPHRGIDFGAPSGANVMAASKGRVVMADYHYGYGNLIVVDHGNGYRTHYAHLSQMKARVGQSVALGDIIGKVGSTGHSTGPHLHFELTRRNTHINPAPYLRS